MKCMYIGSWQTSLSKNDPFVGSKAHRLFNDFPDNVREKYKMNVILLVRPHYIFVSFNIVVAHLFKKKHSHFRKFLCIF